jgi:thiol-disulfide isomerase/thioredoxin
MFVKSLSILIIITLLNFNCLASTKWNGQLVLNSTTTLDFSLILSNSKSYYKLILPNGGENITLTGQKIGDSLNFKFEEYNTRLIFKQHKTQLKGFWVNDNKKNYRVIFKATLPKKDKPSIKKIPQLLNGNFQSKMDPLKSYAYDALGVFTQKNDVVEGTFLTETGDYRYLQGKVKSDSTFGFGCFDGAHAFWFYGKMQKDTLHGYFLSGNHGSSQFWAVQNNSFKLADATTLTTSNTPLPVFSIKTINLDKSTDVFDNASLIGKVTVVQIMGTWCPNCYDETKFLTELHQIYPNLHIKAFAYEAGIDTVAQLQRLKNYKEKLQISYSIYLGGTQNKGLAQKHFSFLDKVMSFPTTIVFDKTGQIAKIYTGFSGPATGTYYTDFKTEFTELITALLSKN